MKTLKYAVRFLIRAKSYTIINLLGLAFSLACCIILMRYLHREWTVDTHCVDRENVYAVKISMEGSEHFGGITPYSYEPIRIDKSKIEVETRYTPLEEDFLIVNEQRFQSRTLVTDSAFFKLFHYPLLQGKLSLDKPSSVLLMKDFAHKLFGNANPIGQVIRHSNGKDLVVEGVLEEPACKTSIRFDMVLSYHLSEEWERMPNELYLFMPGTDMAEINRIGQTPRYLNNPQWDSRQYTFSFLPLKETYWHGELLLGQIMFLYGQKSHLYILAGVCLLIFLTGVLNFVNLYLISMLRRGKEYGLKKVYGAKGHTIFLQIWTENVLLLFAALMVAWFMVEVTAIPINRLLGDNFWYSPFDLWLSLSLLVVLPILTSIYPFFKYNYTSPIRSIRSIGRGNRSVRSRMVFLGIQYVLTFLLVACALYLNKQLNLMLNTNPGFRTENIMEVKLIYDSQDYSNYNEEQWKKKRARNQMVFNKVKACPFVEYTENIWNKMTEKGYETVYITPEGNQALLEMRSVSPTYFKMFDIALEEGTLPNKVEDRQSFYVLNRAAMKAMKFQSLEDAKLIEENHLRKNNQASYNSVMGIVADCYNGHLVMGATPTIYEIGRFGRETVYLAYPEGKEQDLIRYIGEIMKEAYGTESFEYTFLKDDVNKLYNEDRKIANIYTIFAFIAIAISCLGLFGISLFDIRQRYREIGIRKINGAGMKDLYQLLFRKYVVVLGAAFVVAVPIAYYLITLYTQDFVVKAPIGIGIFIIALLVVALISLGTIYWQVHRAANINPADVVKSE